MEFTGTTLHQATQNRSFGMGTYFPNKTTSRNNHIVQMIMEFDKEPQNFGKNNIVMDE